MSADPAVELDGLTTDLADLHRQEAVAFIAWRKSYLGAYTSLIQNQGKSATEARVWAEANALTLQTEHVKLKAEIAALTERRDFLLAVMTCR